MSVHRDEERAARVAREIAARAARRLDYLEWVIFAGAAVLAAAGGAVVAFLLRDLLGLPFRPTWIVASLLLFVVPGAFALRRVRREELEWREKRLGKGQGPDE